MVSSGWFVTWVPSIHSVPGTRLHSPKPRPSYLLKAGRGGRGNERLLLVGFQSSEQPQRWSQVREWRLPGAVQREDRTQARSVWVHGSYLEKAWAWGAETSAAVSAVHKSAGGKWQSHSRSCVSGWRSLNYPIVFIWFKEIEGWGWY